MGRATTATYVEPGGTVSRRVHVIGPIVAVLALLLYVGVYLRWPSEALQIDLSVYRYGASRVLYGLDLYSIGYTGKPNELLFIYPPFAALCFIPLTLLRQRSMDVLWLAAMAALLTFTVARSLKCCGLDARRGLWGLTALLVAVSAWLEPVRLTVQLGQINLAILAIVVADLTGPSRRKWAGIGIGLAAGIKLTPALFIVFLLLIGRVRAAIVATAMFVGTIAVGFVLLPTDSVFYWLERQFDDVSRISVDPFANTSVAGLFSRLHYPHALTVVVASGLAVTGLIVAAKAYRRGQPVLAIGIVGMASTTVSPFSWSHHWVWLVPLVIHLGYRAYALRSRVSMWSMWLLSGLCGGWFLGFGSDPPQAGVLSLRPGGVWNDLVPGTYVFVYGCVCAVTALWLKRELTPEAPAPPVPEDVAVIGA